MTLDSATTAFGAALAFIGAWTGLCWWVYQIRSVAVNARDDLAEYRVATDARLARAETAAEAMVRLADAVKYGSEATATSIANLAEKVAEHATYAKEQFAEIRHEQKAVRQALGAKGSRPQRTS